MDPKKLALAAVAVLALAPRAALAQEKLSFQTIVRSSFGGADKAEQRAIWDVNEYRAFFKGAPPSTPTVKWGEEVVLVLSLGARPTSGYSIEVSRILRGAGTGLRHHAFVEYVERAPKPTDVVASVVTQPLHVVKLSSRDVWQFLFTHDASLARGFDEVSLTIVEGQARTYLHVARDGRSVATVRDAAGKVSSCEGPLNSLERFFLDEAYANNDLLGLPDQVSGSTAAGSVALSVRSGSKSKTFRAPLGVYKDAQNDVTDRVKWVVEELRTAANRIAPSHVAHATVKGRLGAIFYTEDSLAISLEGGNYGPLEIRDARFLPLLRRANAEGRVGAGPLVAHGRTVSAFSIPSAFVENYGTIEIEWVEGRFAGQPVRILDDAGAWTTVTLGGARLVVPSRLVTVAAP